MRRSWTPFRNSKLRGTTISPSMAGPAEASSLWSQNPEPTSTMALSGSFCATRRWTLVATLSPAAPLCGRTSMALRSAAPSRFQSCTTARIEPSSMQRTKVTGSPLHRRPVRSGHRPRCAVEISARWACRSTIRQRPLMTVPPALTRAKPLPRNTTKGRATCPFATATSTVSPPAGSIQSHHYFSRSFRRAVPWSTGVTSSSPEDPTPTRNREPFGATRTSAITTSLCSVIASSISMGGLRQEPLVWASTMSTATTT